MLFFECKNVNVESYPIIIGHETVGIVEEVSENNTYGIKKVIK